MEKNTNILLLECFMRGETSPDEEQILSDWLHSQEAKEQLSNYYQETWKGSNNKLIAEVQGRMFERVKSQMHNAVQELNRRKQKRTMRIRRLFQYAAVILIIIYSYSSPWAFIMYISMEPRILTGCKDFTLYLTLFKIRRKKK